LELGEQTEFPEPPVRINTDLLDAAALGWDESAAWDSFVEYYSR
jgi:UDP-glucose 4-epimerase